MAPWSYSWHRGHLVDAVETDETQGSETGHPNSLPTPTLPSHRCPALLKWDTSMNVKSKYM